MSDKTVEELESENAFLLAFASDQYGVSSIPYTTGGSTKIANITTTRILRWMYLGEEVPENSYPFSVYEMKTVLNFYNQLPAHLKPLAEPVVEQCKEAVARRTEKAERENYMRAKATEGTLMAAWPYGHN